MRPRSDRNMGPLAARYGTAAVLPVLKYGDLEELGS